MATLSMPPPTYSSTPVPFASRPLSTHSIASSSHHAYAPRKSSPLAEGVPTSRPSSLLLSSSPTATPPDSPRSLSFTEASTNSSAPGMLCPKPIHSKPLPARVQTVRRSATAPFTPKPAPAPPSSPPSHRRAQSSQPTQSTSAGPIAENAPQTLPRSIRPVKPSTSRVPEENWMTSESAPRFTRNSLALGAVVLPVRKDDAQRLALRQSTGAHVKYATMPDTAIGSSLSVSSVNQFAFSRKSLVQQKTSPKVPSVRVVDVDGTIQSVDEVGVDLSKRDATWRKETAPFRHVRKFSKDLAAKMKIRSGQAKPTMTVTEEKAFDPVLTEKLAVEKDESGHHPRPPGIPSKRTKSIWAHIIGFSK